MDRLWPAGDPSSDPSDNTADSTAEDAAQVDQDTDELEAFYAFPAELDRPWLRVNFVSSLDGAVTVHGGSRALSSPADQRVLGLIRDLSDVVVVGAATAIIEDYRGLKRTEKRLGRRSRHGLCDVPPIAVVTASCSVAADAGLITDTHVPPIVLTCEAAPKERRKAVADAGADVVNAGGDDVDMQEALSALDARGLRRIACEGGPTLFGTLIEADMVDELCLTLSPLLTGGDAGRIARGRHIEQPRGMRLLSALHTDDSMLLLRYGRAG